MSITNMFKKSAAAAPASGSAKTSEGKDRPVFISFLKDPQQLGNPAPYRIAAFGEGEHTIRLMPASSSEEGAVEVMEAIVLPVRHNGVEGKILVATSPEDPRGNWFFKQVQPWLLKNVRDRFKSQKNPNGDVKLRTQKRVLFFAIRPWWPDPKNQPDKVEMNLTLVNLAGTNYEGAKVGDGQTFLNNDELRPDFDAETGRKIKIKVSGNDPRTRTLKITPERNASPITMDIVNSLPKKDGQPYVPTIESTLNVPTPEIIKQALKETLPADVYERLIAEVQL